MLMVVQSEDELEINFVPQKPEANSIISGNVSRAISGISGTIPAAGIFGLPNPVGQSVTMYVEKNAGAAADAVLIRFWMDGTGPTTESGIPLKDGDKFTITGNFNLINTRLISADGLSHKIHFQYST